MKMVSQPLLHNRALLLVTILSVLASAQVPSLDPAQTVNTLTGQMEFALPLGVVSGANGNDFPVTLDYQSGIRTDQPSSSVGLGFACGTGNISRNIIFCPDDYKATDFASGDVAWNVYNSIPTWIKFLSAGIIVVTVFVAALTSGVGSSLSVAGALVVALLLAGAKIGLNKGMQAGFKAIVTAYYNSLDFTAGGTHVPAFDWRESTLGGYLTGNVKDLPDQYFVNTPYISGELVWVGPPTASGGFVFRQTSGSGEVGAATVDVRYTYPIDGTQCFIITLPDGTKLTFDQVDSYPIHMVSYAYQKDNDTKLETDTRISMRKPVTMTWHLTKVEQPSAPSITFTYNTVQQTGIYSTSVGYRQAGAVGNVGRSYLGAPGYVGPAPYSKWDLNSDYPVTLRFPNRIYAAGNENAMFLYDGVREDNCWLLRNTTTTLYKLPKLTSVRFLDSDGQTIREIAFGSSYSLRAGGARPAGTANPQAASLTLNTVTISDASGAKLPPIVFTYSKNMTISDAPLRDMPFYGQISGDAVDYHIPIACEHRDVWGYYSSNPTHNDWNAAGLQFRAADADAWSLVRAAFPTGGTIQWEYEPNRYDAVNGISYDPEKNTIITSGNGAPRFGGGVRVRKTTANSGLGKAVSTNYFYTDRAGEFVERVVSDKISNSSGHATVEPSNYVSGDDYRTQSARRGGLFTPAKVLYEMTQVAVNYDEEHQIARNGYTVCEYVTSADCPNGGVWGQIDESWRRGLLKQVTVRSRNNTVESQTTYDFKPEMRISTVSSECGYSPTDVMRPYGWVRVTAKHETVKGVQSTTEYAYAQETSGSKDRVVRTAVTEYMAIPNTLYPSAVTQMSITLFPAIFGGTYCDATAFGNSATAPDVVFAGLVGEADDPESITSGLFLKVVPDFDWSTKMQPRSPTCGDWSNPASSTGFKLVYYESKPHRVFGTGSIIALTSVSTSGNSVTLTYQRANRLFYSMVVPNVQINTGSCMITTGIPLPEQSVTTPPPATPRLGKDLRDDEFVVLRTTVGAVSDLDGLPNQVVGTAVNGAKLVSVPKPAYWEDATNTYADLLTKHMLTQQCQTVTYGVPTDEVNPIVPSEHVRSVTSAIATVWGTFNGQWQPKAGYAWKAGLSTPAGNGAPTTSVDFAEFSHVANASNPNWKPIGNSTLYDANGHVVERLSPDGRLYVSTIYDFKARRPIASVTNSMRGECFYSGFEEPWHDYDVAQPWGRCEGGLLWESVPAMHQTGARSARLPNASSTPKYVWAVMPYMSSALVVPRKYVFSAWVYTTGPSASVRLNASVNGSANYLEPFPEVVTPAGALNKWVFLQGTMEAPAGTRLLTVVLENKGQSGSATDVYFDDVRFHPADAAMTTANYDQTLGVVTSSTDANLNTRRSEYDRFGRLTASYDAKGQKVREFEYHVRGNRDIPIYTNHFESGSDPSFAPTTGHCATVSRTAGYSGQGDYIDFCETNVEAAYLSLPKDKMNGKKFTVSGYIKGTAGDQLTAIIVPTADDYQFMTMNGQWQRFEIVADWTSKNYSKADLWIFPEGPYNINVYVDEVTVLGE